MGVWDTEQHQEDQRPRRQGGVHDLKRQRLQFKDVDI